jgi:hypothetical protein
MSINERFMADCVCLDPVYVDGADVEGIVNLGTNFATPFFRWTPIVQGGRITFEKTPALYLVRPIASLDPRDPLVSLLRGQVPPAEAATMMEAVTTFKH